MSLHTLIFAASLTLGLICAANARGIVVHSPEVNTAALPRLTHHDGERNPYRGNDAAITIGRTAFNQTCAQCHGTDADAHASPAPDLRRVGRACARVSEPELKARCTSDADYYFRKSAEEGKVKVGIVHMPPWKDVLSLELIWAIRSFVESPLAARTGRDPDSPELAH